MQTTLIESLRDTAVGHEADAILRACVHCGFCNATCPTYQLLGDELDGPRGRIYLIKQVLEGHAPSAKTQLHLDRCLTCLACETTCPSGVRYGRLVEIGREIVERQVARGWWHRAHRQVLRAVLAHRRRFTPLLRVGQWLRPLLPRGLKRSIPMREAVTTWPPVRHARRVLMLEGCVQPALAPNINAAAARVLDRLGISVERASGAGCCGALSHHNAALDEGREFARRNIDAWWPFVERGVEAIVITASGCGVHVKDYAHVLRDDPAYAAKAERVARLARDIAEIVAEQDLDALRPPVVTPRATVAFHSPCTLQHGQHVHGVVEKILRTQGFVLTTVPDAHLCCGAAGTYALLQRDLSRRLLGNKLAALESTRPDIIATANIGCLSHLASRASVPVRHWIEMM